MSDQIARKRYSVFGISCLAFLLFLSLRLSAIAQSADEGAIRKLASTLASAETDDERNALLVAKKDLVTKEIVRFLHAEGVQLYHQGSYTRALGSFRLALEIA